MKEESEYTLRIPKFYGDAIEKSGKDLNTWSQEVITLGLLVERGEIFQQVGQEFVKLRMTDIEPIARQAEEESLLHLKISDKITSELIRTHGRDIWDWVRRAINLRQIAPNLGLFKKRDGEYVALTLG